MINVKQLSAAIQWHEGMLLAPQHFQQLSMRQEQLLAYQFLTGHPFCWGVRTVEFDGALFSAGKLRVNRLEAIMPDGQVVFTADANDAASDRTLEVDLVPFSEQLDVGDVKVYLAVAIGDDRYYSVSGELVVDDNGDSDGVDIPRLLPKLQLMVGDVPSARYVSFPLVGIRRQNGVFKFGEYIPPSIFVSRDTPLWKSCNVLAGIMREKATYLAKQVSGLSSSLEDRLCSLEIRDRLRSIVDALPCYEAILETDQLHPYPLYVALSTLLGPLSLLGKGAVPFAPVSYRHIDLRSTFDTLILQVSKTLEEVSQSYREIKFTRDGTKFSVLLDPHWGGERIVVGLRGSTAQDHKNWIGNALIGSSAKIGEIAEKRILGAARAHIERADEIGLGEMTGTTLFSIRNDPSFVLSGEQLVIDNRSGVGVAQLPTEVIFYLHG